MRAGSRVDSLRRAIMRWLFGCFYCGSDRKNKHGVAACQSLKASNRRDKAQVLPDSGLDSSPDLEVIKSRGKGRTDDDPQVAGASCEEQKQAFHSSSSSSTHENKESSTPAESIIPPRDEYLSIDSIFPASLFSDDSFKRKEDSEDCLSLSSETRSTQTQLSFDEKPIMGLVAATTDWIDSDSGGEVKTYKPWDGKGIPNSTSKYKEDQTINFQTLSFEARLEQALAAQNV